MRDRLVVVELDPLRVDQDHPHLVRRRAQQDRGQDRVDAARLARAGRAGDQDVRHPREVGPDGVAGDVLAEPDRERARGRGQVVVDVAERDDVRAQSSAPRRRPPACPGSARGCGSRSSRARRRGRPSAAATFDDLRAGRELQLVARHARAGDLADDASPRPRSSRASCTSSSAVARGRLRSTARPRRRVAQHRRGRAAGSRATSAAASKSVCGSSDEESGSTRSGGGSSTSASPTTSGIVVARRRSRRSCLGSGTAVESGSRTAASAGRSRRRCAPCAPADGVAASGAGARRARRPTAAARRRRARTRRGSRAPVDAEQRREDRASALPDAAAVRVRRARRRGRARATISAGAERADVDELAARDHQHADDERARAAPRRRPRRQPRGRRRRSTPPTEPPSQPSQSSDARKSPSATSPSPTSSGRSWCVPTCALRVFFLFAAPGRDFGRALEVRFFGAMNGAFAGRGTLLPCWRT